MKAESRQIPQKLAARLNFAHYYRTSFLYIKIGVALRQRSSVDFMEVTNDQTYFSIYCSTLCAMQPLHAVVANMVELIKSSMC